MTKKSSNANIDDYISLLRALVRDFGKKARELKEMIDEDTDEFGMSQSFMDLCRPMFQFLYYRYFRVDAVGIEHIPPRVPAILVANHSGTIPYDGIMSHLAVFNEHAAARKVRFLVDDFVFNIPFLRDFIVRTGGVRASFDNALKLLKAGHVVMIFPEGVDGIGKTFAERYELRPFEKGGFVRLSILTKAPIIPVSIIGAEEIHPLIWKSKALGKYLGLPFIPFTPTFPWLGPMGLVPLPSKWKIFVGKPIRLKNVRASDARNDKLVRGHAEKVRAIIQMTLYKELGRRKSIWI